MAKETEIKLRIQDLPALQRNLRKLRARIAVPRTLEHNLLFDTARSDLKRREQLLRIRTETRIGARRAPDKEEKRALLTFKQPEKRKSGSRHHKTREETELEASDDTALASIFKALRLRPWFHYEKFRTTYRLPQSHNWARSLLIELDETPIGVFLELEGPGSAIDRAAKALGFAHADYIVSNYIELYRQHCRKQGKQPTAMTFRTRSNA